MAKKILVIDDEELITKSLFKLLSAEGYDVSIVRNGKDAVEKVQISDFNLIISDVRMPDLDGIETLRQIRAYLKQLNKKLIPEILITGYADKEKYEAAMSDLKVKEYIYKPFERAEFLKTVKSAIA